MKNLIITSFVLACALFSLTTCKKEDKSPNLIIEAQINNKITNTTRITPGHQTLLSVDVNGVDSINYSYSWKASGGLFIGENNTSSVIWEAPVSTSLTEYQIEVKVSTEQQSSSVILLINVIAAKPSNEWHFVKSLKYGTHDFGYEQYENFIFITFGDELYQYDILFDDWKKVCEMPQGQVSCTSELLNNKIYLFGSRTVGERGISNLIQVYDIETNSWDTNIDRQLPDSLYWATSESYNNEIYIIGGYSPGSDHPKRDEVSIYNPESNTWNNGTPIPVGMQNPNSVKYNNKFYVWTGQSTQRSIYVYDPSTDSWEKLDVLGEDLQVNQEGLVYNDYILFFGGTESSGISSPAKKTIIALDPTTQIYFQLSAELNLGRHSNYGVVAYKNEIFVFGGRTPKYWSHMEEVEHIVDISLEP